MALLARRGPDEERIDGLCAGLCRLSEPIGGGYRGH